MTIIIDKVKDKYKELNESFATARKEREKARKNKKEEINSILTFKNERLNAKFTYLIIERGK